MSAFMSAFAHLVGLLADVLQPLFHDGAAAAAIILFTACVRLAVHPLSRASARGQKARTKLAPQIAELRKKHAKNPERMQKALMELHTKEKVSPLSGCLPSLAQMPAFFLMYHLFSSREIGGRANELLGHSLFAAPLGERWADALAGGGVAAQHPRGGRRLPGILRGSGILCTSKGGEQRARDRGRYRQHIDFGQFPPHPHG